MTKKDDDFVKKAFEDALKVNAKKNRIEDESNAAEDAFYDYFIPMLLAFYQRLGNEKGGKFLAKNDDENCHEAIMLLAETYFLAGFRSGILYEKDRKRSRRKPKSDKK